MGLNPSADSLLLCIGHAAGHPAQGAQYDVPLPESGVGGAPGARGDRSVQENQATRVVVRVGRVETVPLTPNFTPGDHDTALDVPGLYGHSLGRRVDGGRGHI